jgi:hypothetical protein
MGDQGNKTNYEASFINLLAPALVSLRYIWYSMGCLLTHKNKTTIKLHVLES